MKWDGSDEVVTVPLCRWCSRSLPAPCFSEHSMRARSDEGSADFDGYCRSVLRKREKMGSPDA